MCSHGGELGEEVRGNGAEVLQHLHRALPHTRLVVPHAVLLAEGLHQLVQFPQLVPRDHGEQVVVHLCWVWMGVDRWMGGQSISWPSILTQSSPSSATPMPTPTPTSDSIQASQASGSESHLVAEAAAEPLDEPPARDVARGGDLELPEVGPLVGVVDGHAVVAEAEDEREEEAAHHLGGEEVEERAGGRHVQPHERAVPGVVREEAELLEAHVLDGLALGGGALGGPERRAGEGVEDEEEGLEEPRDARDEEDGEVEDGLVADEEGPQP